MNPPPQATDESFEPPIRQEDVKIEVSRRIRRLPPYLFSRLNTLKYEKRHAGIDLIDLGMGNPVDRTPQPIVDKLCQAVQDPRNHRYSVSTGLYNLRREVAYMYERRFGVSLDPHKQIIACLGSKEGFSHMCLSLLESGDTAVVPDPSYPIHVYAVALAGANVIRVTIGRDQEFLSRISSVLEHLYPRPKLIILNFPNNPTAMTVDPGFFDEVVKLAKRFGVFVIHDFAYGMTVYDGYEAPSFLQARGATDVGVEMFTMSKPYNMAGWRVGFIIGNADMIQALATVKSYYDYGHFAPVQIASIIALRNHDEDTRAQAAVYCARRNLVADGLRRIGWELELPRGSMFVWTKIAPRHLQGRGTIDFCLDLVEKAEVVIAPGRAFGEAGEGFARVALVENDLRLKQAMRQIDRALNRNPASSQKTAS